MSRPMKTVHPTSESVTRVASVIEKPPTRRAYSVGASDPLRSRHR